MSTLLDLDPATKFGTEAAAASEKEVAENVAKEAVLKAMESDAFTSAEDLQKVHAAAMKHAIEQRGMFSRGRVG